MASREGKVALVLAGGGMPGWMYEVGCLKALDEFFDDGFTVNDFDIFVGTSAGAAVAALIANQIPPKDLYEAIYENKEHT
jgi:predicted acylesterase/phospholipase RssA